MTPQEYQFMQHKIQLIIGLRCFCINLNSACFEIKIMIRNIVFTKVRLLIGRRIRIRRRLHVNQPLRLIHMYPASESSRSESGPFVIGDYFL